MSDMNTNTHTLANPFDLEVEAPDDARVALLGRLVNASRSTRGIAPLGDSPLHEAALDWHEALLPVPTDALAALRVLGVQQGLSTAPEFLALYRDLDYKRRTAIAVERQVEKRDEDALWAARIEAERAAPPSPVRRAFQLQFERLGKGKLAIACDCDKNSVPVAATLDPGCENWVCAKGECAFSLPIAHTHAHEARGVLGILGQIVRVDVTGAATSVESVEHKSEPKPRSLEHERAHRDAKACGLSLADSTPTAVMNFMTFSKWYYARYTDPLTEDLLSQLWNVWWEEWVVERDRLVALTKVPAPQGDVEDVERARAASKKKRDAGATTKARPHSRS